eukprot:1896970-Pleurochrysis_carterae.AAC.1
MSVWGSAFHHCDTRLCSRPHLGPAAEPRMLTVAAVHARSESTAGREGVAYIGASTSRARRPAPPRVVRSAVGCAS